MTYSNIQREYELAALTPGLRLWRRSLQLLVRVLVKLLVNHRVSGKQHLPKTGPYIVGFNHTSNFDMPVVVCAMTVPPEMIGAREVFGWPVIGWLGKTYRAFPVNRDNPEKAMLKVALAALEDGRVMLLSPEGYVSEEETLLPGKRGSAWLARKTGAPVVPVAVTGTRGILPALKRFRRATVTVSFGEPVHVAHTADRRADLADGAERIMLGLARMLPERQRGVYADAVKQLEDTEREALTETMR